MKQVKERVAWIDLMRILVCLMVVLAHCCDPFVARFDTDLTEFRTGIMWGSLFRPCVPLFAMMTGVLLLPFKGDMTTFYRKRIMRVSIALAFWSIVSTLMFYFYYAAGASTVHPNISLDDHLLSATFTKVYTFVFNFNYDTVPLWYIYMLIGLYLVIPIISPWLLQASKRDLKLFLSIWCFTLLMPYLQIIVPSLGYKGNWGNMGLFGVCDWNPFGTFYYLSGFLGYIVLAYYLVKYPLNWSWSKTLAIAVPLFTFGYFVNSYYFFKLQEIYPGNYAYLELIWYFCSFHVMLMTAACFIVVQKISLKPSAILSKLASLTFGVYLSHWFFVHLSYDLLYEVLPLHPVLKIPVIGMVAAVMTFFLVALMNTNRITRRFIQ